MATSEGLEALLRARLDAAGHELRNCGFSVSRRSFLAGLVATPAAAAPALSGGGGDPVLRWNRSMLTLAFGGERWSLDRAALGSGASLKAWRANDGYFIRLDRAMMPGTAMPVSFILRLVRGRGRWMAHVRVPGLHIAAEMELGEWMRGVPARGRTRSTSLAAGSGRLTMGAGAASLSSESGLTLRYACKVALSGRSQCKGNGLTLRLAARTAALHAEGDAGGWATAFEVETPVMSRRAFACGDESQSLVAIRSHEANRLTGEFFDGDGTRQEVALIEGPAQLEMRKGSGSATPLRFDRAVVSVGSKRIGIAGKVSETPAYLASGRCLAGYRGDPAEQFYATFEAGKKPHFTAAVRASELWLPIGGAESAVLSLPDQPMRLATAPALSGAFDTIVIGDQPSVITKLDNTTLTIRSTGNLLDLRFRFTGFEFVWHDIDGPHLRRQKEDGYYIEGWMVVEFPPQHQSETIQVWDGTPGCIPATPGTLSHLSGESRIAFKFEKNATAPVSWHERPLTLESLTDWSELKMDVDGRALSDIRDDDLTSQLKAVDINATDTLDAALGKIAGKLGAPGINQTALELADRLIFSPSEDAIWERSSVAQGTSMPIFGVRIGNANDARLRALHSRMFAEHVIPREADLSDLYEDDSPLSKRQHWEIVGQTSTYGLPALRRIVDEDESKPADDPNTALTKVPRGGVVRPDPAPKYVREVDVYLASLENPIPSPAPPEAGIALATAFQEADVTLTSLGATMRLDWRGEPALLKAPNGKLPDSFSLERLAYQTWLGRDVRVIAVEKGYLFPFGIAASLLRVSERVFLPDASGKPVGKEIRRQFIVASRAPKIFPAANQPDGGRDFPASSVTLQTVRTPDLVPPDTIENGTLDIEGLGTGAAFWPRVRTLDNKIADFEWKSLIDGDSTPLISNMIFVKHGVVGNPDLVEKIVKYYNAHLVHDSETDSGGDPGRRDTWPRRNVAKLGGARRSYAPRRQEAPAMPGRQEVLPAADTAYDTDSWLIVARGRSSGPGQPDNYIMDARMNGADQPPFFPCMLRAAIAVQSIDRLVGRPQGLIETRLYAPFVTHGIDGPQNAGEIFLEVVWPMISLDVAKEGRPSTGGVAQPATSVAALSRMNGVVGGKKGAVATLAKRGDVPALLNFQDAAKGTFNPKQFFDLRLFGINILEGLADNLGFGAAPRLSEIVDQGVSSEQRDAIRAAAADAKKVVENAKKSIDADIFRFNGAINNPNVTFAKLYPELDAAYQGATMKIIAELGRIENAADVETMTQAAIRVTAAAKPLLREIGRMTHDPVPPQVNDAIAQITGRWNTFASALTGFQHKVEQAVPALIRAQIEALADLGADQLALLFGLESDQTVVDLITNAEARARLGETLLYEQIGVPILDLIDKAAQFSAALGGVVGLVRSEIKAAAEKAIHDAVMALAGRLIDEVGAAHNILREEDVEVLAVALADAANRTLTTLTTGQGNPLETLARIHGELSSGAAGAALRSALANEIATRRDWIRAAVATDIQLYEAFAAAVLNATLAVVVDEARERIEQTQRLLVAIRDKGVDAIVEIVLDGLGSTLAGAEALQRLATVAKLGRQLSGWCTNATQGAFAAVRALGDGVLAGQSDIDAWIGDIGVKVRAVQLPTMTPAQLEARFVAIKAAMHQALDAAAAASQTLKEARERLDQISAGDTCATTTAFAKSLADCITLRHEALGDLRQVILQVRALGGLAESGSADFQNAIKAQLALIVADVRKLVTGLSVAGTVDLPGIWADVVAVAKNRLMQIGVVEFKTELERSYNQLVAQGTAIRTEIRNAGPAELIGLLERAIALADPDRKLAGLVIETIALADEARGKIEKAAYGLIKGVATPLRELHETALIPLAAVQKIGVDNPTIAYLLDGFAAFDQDVSAVRLSITKLQAVEAAGNFDAAQAALADLRTIWLPNKPIPLMRAVGGLARFIDAIFKGQFGKLIGEGIRRALLEMEDKLRDMIARFVPSRIQTRYDWNTKIGPVDAGIIKFNMVSEGNKNLVLTSVIDFNFISGSRSARVSGEIEPFKLSIQPLFDIYFKKATFLSVNGASPDFRADIDNVVLGPALKFLEQLRQIIAPSGNGFYVRPSFSGITVGYGFARDIFNVGSLTLSNIAMDVFAELPFGAGSTRFGFLFASKERPFLISNPPYGGGGWVRIVSNTRGPTEIGISFMFGAVTDIAFGPLRGQGRICAGITWTNATITTFFEAVGEGSIACFSISIYIGFFLTHNLSTGSLDGSARFEYGFKVGFYTFKYKVTATKHIAGPSGKAPPPEPETASLGGFGSVALRVAGGMPIEMCDIDATTSHKHTSAVPPKSMRWREYRQCVALELLRD